LESRQPG